MSCVFRGEETGLKGIETNLSRDASVLAVHTPVDGRSSPRGVFIRGLYLHRGEEIEDVRREKKNRDHTVFGLHVELVRLERKALVPWVSHQARVLFRKTSLTLPLHLCRVEELSGGCTLHEGVHAWLILEEYLGDRQAVDFLRVNDRLGLVERYDNVPGQV